jgi:hypothetical protein
MWRSAESHGEARGCRVSEERVGHRLDKKLTGSNLGFAVLASLLRARPHATSQQQDGYIRRRSTFSAHFALAVQPIDSRAIRALSGCASSSFENSPKFTHEFVDARFAKL